MRPDAIALAEALAVLGSQNEVITAAAMAGLDVAAAELAADELAAAQILMPARPLDFFHPLIGESVYASIGLGARRLSHRRAAALLDRAGTADRVAAHLLATGPAGDDWVDVATIAGAAGTLADAYLISDRIDAAVAVLQEASRRVAVTDPPNAASLEAWSVLLGIQDDRTAPEALEAVDRWRARLHSMPDPPLHCLVALAQIAVRRNQADVAVPLLERILACRPYPPPVDAGACAIAALVCLEDYCALDQLCGDTLASLEQRSAVPWLVVVTGFSAWGMLHRGELADAEAQSRWALQHAGTGTLVAIDLVAHLVDVLIERDELELAEAELARIPSPLDSHSITVLNYLMARGRLRAAQGRPAEALQDFLLVGKRCEPLGIVLGWYQWRSQAAIVQASLGRVDDARTLARAEVAVARSAGLPRQLGLALRSSGLVEPGGADLELLAESVSVLETSQSRIELARALADYGAALRRAGHRTQARRTLERALDLAHYCGARRIAAWAREELVAAGAKPRREAITGRDALTPSELRVARLAAEGHTDREIAQSLFITTKTASVHLSRAYRKLGVSRRSDLAKALASSIS
jgi:DNA-binding CsgD family transcriptional regulator